MGREGEDWTQAFTLKQKIFLKFINFHVNKGHQTQMFVRSGNAGSIVSAQIHPKTKKMCVFSNRMYVAS